MKYALAALLAISMCQFATAEDEYAKPAFELMQKHKIGMVSTVIKDEGVQKPYGSVMPFILKGGAPVVFICDLSVHTDNIKANPNVSVMVFSPDKFGNVFNGSRVTFSGKMEIVEDEKQIAQLRKAYLAVHPDSKLFIDFGDFNYYMLDVKSIYFIGGFGEIGYVDLDEYKKVAQQKAK